RHPRSALALRRSFGRECSRRGSSDIAGRRRRNIARADLYRLTCIPDDAACNVVDGLGCPVAPGSVNGLCVTWVHHIAWRSGGNDGTGDHAPPMTPAATPGPHPHPRRRHWAETSVALAVNVSYRDCPFFKRSPTLHRERL